MLIKTPVPYTSESLVKTPSRSSRLQLFPCTDQRRQKWWLKRLSPCHPHGGLGWSCQLPTVGVNSWRGFPFSGPQTYTRKELVFLKKSISKGRMSWWENRATQKHRILNVNSRSLQQNPCGKMSLSVGSALMCTNTFRIPPSSHLCF